MKPLRTALLATLIAAAVLLCAFSVVVAQSSFPGTIRPASSPVR